jgi:hypothetical protein
LCVICRYSSIDGGSENAATGECVLLMCFAGYNFASALTVTFYLTTCVQSRNICACESGRPTSILYFLYPGRVNNVEHCALCAVANLCRYSVIGGGAANDASSTKYVMLPVICCTSQSKCSIVRAGLLSNYLFGMTVTADRYIYVCVYTCEI